jgi:hypothetical protein
VFDKAEIVVTADNRKEIDKMIHEIVEVRYKNCPSTWREVKKLIAEDEKAFIERLKEAYANMGDRR